MQQNGDTGEMEAREVYEGSDGELTKRYYAELEKLGPVGIVALNLFRAQKNSTRAKKYRGGIRGVGSFRGMAYDRKQWAISNLCQALQVFAEELGIEWGWGRDLAEAWNSWVLYVELPELGQVSFHSPARGEGPDYQKQWDGKKLSEERIIRFCDQVYHSASETASLVF